jgi:hypothetical protein
VISLRDTSDCCHKWPLRRGLQLYSLRTEPILISPGGQDTVLVGAVKLRLDATNLLTCPTIIGKGKRCLLELLNPNVISADECLCLAPSAR